MSQMNIGRTVAIVWILYLLDTQPHKPTIKVLRQKLKTEYDITVSHEVLRREYIHTATHMGYLDENRQVTDKGRETYHKFFGWTVQPVRHPTSRFTTLGVPAEITQVYRLRMTGYPDKIYTRLSNALASAEKQAQAQKDNT